jgi:hypothetical protein
MRKVLLMAGWVELPAVPAKRLVWTSAGDTLHDGLRAFLVTVAFFSAPRADLGLGTLVGFVFGDLLAVVALLGAFASFEYPCLTRQPSCIKVPFSEETLCVCRFGEVHYDRSIFLRRFAAAEPLYSCHLNFVLLAEFLCRSLLIIASLVQRCSSDDAIDSDRIQVVT